MSKKSTTDTPSVNREEADLWRQFAAPEREAGYDLHNPEILNALAAYAEGHSDDPGREHIERSLLESDQALADLAFLREIEAVEPQQLADEVRGKACSLVPGDAAQPTRKEGLFGWFGSFNDFIFAHTQVTRGWAVGLAFAGMVCFSLVGFQLGVVTQQQRMAVNHLMLADFPATLDFGSVSTLFPPGGGL